MGVIEVHQKYRWKWYEKFYVMSISMGLLTTLKHFIKSQFLRKQVTVQYPEEKRVLNSRFRGLHQLKRDEKNRERCTACYCCQWICPADAIYIEAAEVTPERSHLHAEDKYAKVFNIDMLRCIFCGLCEEACPKGAIYLDGDIPMPTDNRGDLVYTKDMMMEKNGSAIIGIRN